MVNLVLDKAIITTTEGVMMKIFAAIDLKGGQCVRLEQRDPKRETVYGEEPAKFAEAWEAVGTDWLVGSIGKYRTVVIDPRLAQLSWGRLAQV